MAITATHTGSEVRATTTLDNEPAYPLLPLPTPEQPDCWGSHFIDQPSCQHAPESDPRFGPDHPVNLIRAVTCGECAECQASPSDCPACASFIQQTYDARLRDIEIEFRTEDARRAVGQALWDLQNPLPGAAPEVFWVGPASIADSASGVAAAYADYPDYPVTAAKSSRIVRDVRGGLDVAACETNGLTVYTDATAAERAAQAKREQAVEREADRIEIRRDALALVHSREVADIELPPLVCGNDFLTQHFADDAFVIGGILPTDGNMVVLAQRKAGKSTLMLNLIRSLVDGDDFLEQWPVSTTRRVTYLDFELSDQQAQRWLSTQGIDASASWSRVGLRGRARSFDIRDDATRARWAQVLRDAGTEVLILDPLKPLLDALALKEANEIGVVLEAFEALKTEAGIHEGVVVHHMGWNDEHSRGDSRVEDWPDSIVKLRIQDPDDAGSFRYLRALGREVDVPEGLLARYAGNRLRFDQDARRAVGDVLVERLTHFIAQHPGCSATDLESVVGVTPQNRAGLVRQAEQLGLIEVIKQGTKKTHYVREQNGAQAA